MVRFGAPGCDGDAQATSVAHDSIEGQCANCYAGATQYPASDIFIWLPLLILHTQYRRGVQTVQSCALNGTDKERLEGEKHVG
jgi:hypothetical protein